WMKRDFPPDRGILRQALHALREEYAEKRKLLLMVKPSITSWLTEDANPVFREEGFHASSLRDPYHTIVMDISQPLDSLRKGMKPAWRRNLNKAEKNNLEVESGAGENLLGELSELYRQMLARKQFTNIADFNFYEKLQRELDEPYKFHILVCRQKGAPVAGLICSPLGQTSLVANGATGSRGLDLFGSYLLWWKAIEHLKAQGHRWLDTCGINRTHNPGGYQFKSGVCGKWGRDIQAGEFQYCENFMSWAAARGGQSVRQLGTRIREFIVLKRTVRRYEHKE
ncbi:MAG: lipid II:glycine glycyltransferase FemX, partial [Candidatus Latescibacterota bacterium]